MTQRTRILIALGVLVALAALVLGVDAWQRAQLGPEPELPPGSIPIRMDGRLVGGFTAGDLEALQEASFVDAEEGKTQDGWMLRDVLLLRVKRSALRPTTLVRVSSSSRGKTVEVIWAEVDDPANMVMFDLSGRGTLKLVSLLPQLDVRDEWVQDVDGIEIVSRGESE
ncbi:MAG: hypothetical protein GXY76_05295 [Chloroflexi bacterium]|nr:hypothetical protein [Chloroflexota bacterium]